MQIKHLQLNTSVIKDPQGIKEFVKQEQFDICNFQELIYYSDKPCILHEIAADLGYYFVEAVNFTLLDDETKPVRISSVGIMSKFRVVDYQIYYSNTENDTPRHLVANDLVNDVPDENSFPGSRGLKHSKKSRAILRCVLDTGETTIADITAQFNVSDLCTETTEIFKTAEKVVSILKNTSALPTIFAGDINIRLRSYSGELLKSVMDCHSEKFTDTLASNHRAHNDFPDGLSIDHVFSKSMKCISCEAIDNGLSDHKSIVSVFEL